VVVAAQGATVDAAELVRRCRERLASFKAPEQVVLQTETPATHAHRQGAEVPAGRAACRAGSVFLIAARKSLMDRQVITPMRSPLAMARGQAMAVLLSLGLSADGQRKPAVTGRPATRRRRAGARLP
jgi:hypothetical protein